VRCPDAYYCWGRKQLDVSLHACRRELVPQLEYFPYPSGSIGTTTLSPVQLVNVYQGEQFIRTLEAPKATANTEAAKQKSGRKYSQSNEDSQQLKTKNNTSPQHGKYQNTETHCKANEKPNAIPSWRPPNQKELAAHPLDHSRTG
jgi:hypothetical protein